MKGATLAAMLAAMAGTANGLEVVCANGVEWSGPGPEACPCCEVCADGSWVVVGVDRCPAPPVAEQEPEPATKHPITFGKVTPGAAHEDESSALSEWWRGEGGALTLIGTIAVGWLAFVSLPAVIAFRRRHHQRLPILALTIANVFASATVWVFPLSIGAVPLLWFVALVWSLSAVKAADEHGRVLS